jgi:hypothetical protein
MSTVPTRSFHVAVALAGLACGAAHAAEHVDDRGKSQAAWKLPRTEYGQPTEERMHEYACHEGNYALPGILAGAREEEKNAAVKKP